MKNLNIFQFFSIHTCEKKEIVTKERLFQFTGHNQFIGIFSKRKVSLNQMAFFASKLSWNSQDVRKKENLSKSFFRIIDA